MKSHVLHRTETLLFDDANCIETKPWHCRQNILLQMKWKNKNTALQNVIFIIKKIYSHYLK